MKLLKLTLLMGIQATLLFYSVDCVAPAPLDAASMQCCASMPCTPANQHHDCCKHMPPTHMVYMQAPSSVQTGPLSAPSLAHTCAPPFFAPLGAPLPASLAFHGPPGDRDHAPPQDRGTAIVVLRI